MMKTCMEIIKREDCTGCGACENICPVNAVSMDVDEEGFWYVHIDRQVCISCERCINVCPVLQEKMELISDRSADDPVIYAAWSLNPEIRYQSTSGGIFSELSLAVLEEQGFICGAVYDEKQQVWHFITNEEQGLAKIRQSKYVQSHMGSVFKKIENLLRQNRTFLFCGSPCQCAGMFYYCREKKVGIKNLYLIDFICRGANSPKVYQKFISELEEKYQSAVSKVWFKNKAYGWNRFSTRIEFENGRYYLLDRYHDPYIRGYIEENLYIRPSCAHCRFKGMHRIADITLADFWGIQLHDPTQDSDGGTSMVMLHTEKGQKLWNTIKNKVYYTQKKIEDVISGNVCFENSVEQGIHRAAFMKDLDVMPVIENIERFLKGNGGGGS